jgi:hypothetical protein
MLRDEIGTIRNQLPVHTEDWPQSRLNLFPRVEWRLQNAGGYREKGFQLWDIARHG